jgi:RimJ/RimL family protein N-acetyltransferase
MPDVRIPLDYHVPFNLNDEQDWFENCCQAEGEIHLLIYHKDDDQRLGTIGIEINDQLSRVAELGFFIHPDYHGQGMGTEAAELALDYAFSQLNLHKVWARAAAFNDKSIGLMEKLGFEQEGQLRDHAFINGSHVDVVKMGLLRDEWEKQ